MRIEVLAAASVLLMACGGDDGVDPVEPIDAGRSLDSEVIPCSDAADCATEPFARLCAEPRCVECLGSTDCDDPLALGPQCDIASGQCRCEAGRDCSGNRNGPVCNEIARACGCISDLDCPDPQKCELEPYLGSGVRTCQPR